MRQQDSTAALSDAEFTGAHAQEIETIGSEDLLVRSYDHHQSYDLEIEVVGPDGEVVFEQRYYLQPGGIESELSVVDGGEYEVRVTLDNARRIRRRLHIGGHPSQTAVIEVGNGALSLTEGLDA